MLHEYNEDPKFKKVLAKLVDKDSLQKVEDAIM
jgi:hypothetical protein